MAKHPTKDDKPDAKPPDAEKSPPEPAAARKARVSLAGFPPLIVEIPAGAADPEAAARKAYLDALGVWGPANLPEVELDPKD